MEQADIIHELQQATGWKDISSVGDSFVLRLDIREMRCIKGLKQGNNCLYLEYDDFHHIPISFMVTVGTTVHQYWTLGRQLHRVNDQPAYVSYDPNNDRIIRRWYWNGLKHRIVGPAQEMIKGYKVVDVEGISGYCQESWQYMKVEWFREGFPAKFPYCAEATIEAGTRIKHKTTGRLHSPLPGVAAFSADHAEFVWESAGKDVAFRPTTADILQLSELYDDGNLTGRECLVCNFNWRQGDAKFLSKEYGEFNDQFRLNLLPIIDLWGEFYKDEGDEFITMTEFTRIGKDKE